MIAFIIIVIITISSMTAILINIANIFGVIIVINFTLVMVFALNIFLLF